MATGLPSFYPSRSMKNRPEGLVNVNVNVISWTALIRNWVSCRVCT